MLGLLDSEVHTIPCTDEVDETRSTAKWHNKAAQALEKLNKDSSNTAGLEATLKIAVGARVMLRRNIDVKGGLVNGAIGTVLEIHPSRISIKFDHLIEPCDIKRVSGKFLVMRNCYVQRTQFPLILAYAVTIHKCQGLSLDCAIIDLSEKIFADGMAYVALSRVRSLDGLHLTAFHPASIKVNVKCLREINRLRQLHRKDLPLYEIPVTSAKKLQLTGACEGDTPLLPPKKRRKTVQPSRKVTSKQLPKKAPVLNTKSGRKVASKQPSKKTPVLNTSPTPDVIDLGDGQAQAFKFNPVDVKWQGNACRLLGVPYVQTNGVHKGGNTVPLTPPDKCHIKGILPDGNCMFRSLSYVVTGSEEHHKTVRSKIVNHINHAPSRILQHIKGQIDYCDCKSVAQYLQKSKMALGAVMLSFCPLLI